MTHARRRTTAIVGGGMLGMALALDLADRGDRAVTLYERAPELGGLAAPWEIGGVRWDRHYHVILPSDSALLALLERLRLRDALEWSPARSAFYVGGRMHPFTTPLDFLRFPAIGPADKLRLLATIARARRLPANGSWRRQTIEQWLRAAGGDRVFERVWRPLLRAKLGSEYDDVGAAFIVATIRRLYGGASAPAHLRGRFGYVRGGYAPVIAALAAQLAAAGVRLRTATPVDRVESHGDGGMAVVSGRRQERFDDVAITLPPPLAAPICAPLSDLERSAWSAVRYRGIVCASLLCDRPLGQAYVTNLAAPGLPFTAVIEMTNLVDRAQFGGRHLVYLPRYCAALDPYALASEERITEDFLAGVQRVFPRFDRRDVRALRVSRVPYVFALAQTHPQPSLQSFETSVPGLYLATSAQIADGTLNVNETLELAHRAARTMRGSSFAQPAGAA